MKHQQKLTHRKTNPTQTSQIYMSATLPSNFPNKLQKFLKNKNNVGHTKLVQNFS